MHQAAALACPAKGAKKTQPRAGWDLAKGAEGSEILECSKECGCGCRWAVKSVSILKSKSRKRFFSLPPVSISAHVGVESPASTRLMRFLPFLTSPTKV